MTELYDFLNTQSGDRLVCYGIIFTICVFFYHARFSLYI